MADTKDSALPAATSVAAADQLYLVQSGVSKSVTASVLRASAIGEGLSNASVVGTSAAYAVDTYLAGSAITTTAGAWQVGTICKWQFDMVKTGAGTATPILIVRMGTLGTTGDAAIATLTWAVGTGVVDTARFDITVNFRTVGSGTSAVINANGSITHHLAATGMTTTGASGIGIINAVSSGFNSTTQTIIGLSFNGGASFSGTNNYVFADADKL